MKIHFIIGSLIGGGAERVMVLLANYLGSKSNYEISLITFNGPEEYTTLSGVERIKLHKITFKNHKLRRVSNLFSFYRDKNNRPQVIISFITDLNLIAIPVAKLYGIKIICSEHFNHTRKGSYYTRFTRSFLYRFADKVTVLTEFDLSFYKKKGINVAVMPNPSTFEVLQEVPENRENIILAVGNLNKFKHKGFDNLIEIVAPLLKNQDLWKLQIVGGGEEGMKFLKSLVVNYELDDKIDFIGFSKNIISHLRKAKIFALSSREEGLPMVLIEAMSQGVASIAFDCITGPSDIITNNYDGLLVENQNINEFTEKLKNLMEDSKSRNTLGSNAIRSVKRYDIKKIINKWEEIFKEVCG